MTSKTPSIRWHSLSVITACRSLLQLQILGAGFSLQEIAERYSTGETMADLAREYECGEATIWRALRPA